METLLFLLVLIVLAVMFRAERRINALQRDLAALRQELGQAEAAPATSPWGEPRERTAAQAPEPTDDGGASTEVGAPPEPPPLPGRTRRALARLKPWLRDNWIYPLAGAALVLSGVFLVQYAIEAGRMTPAMQITLAALLAGALIACGEWLRRKPLAGIALPATLTGAGLVIAMATVLAALHVHAMLTPAPALVLLAALSFVAIALGWVHGPMLVALGLVAGSGVPFALGGDGPPPPALFGYFTLLAVAGFAIDGLRRWGWVSWLALACPVAAMVLWRLGGADALGFALAVTLVAGAAMTLPFGYLMPVATGPRALGRAQPMPGVRASFVATGAAALGLALLVPGLAAPIGLTALAVLAALWCRRAPALSDQMLWPLLGFPLWILLQGWIDGPLHVAFSAPRLPESAMPLQATIILALATLGALALLWRGEAEDPGRHAPVTLAGLALPGGALVALETAWAPAATLGAYEWALHAMALAGAATVLALRYGVRDGGTGPRLGASSSAAFALIALALMLMLSTAALNVALAVLMVAAAAMDRRFDIPGLGAFMVLALLVLGWRLVLEPGIFWHLNAASLPAFALSLAAIAAGPWLALQVIAPRADEPLRRYTRLMLETGLISHAAIVAGLVIARLLPDRIGLHAQVGLMATVLIVLAWAQHRRAALPVARQLRIAFASALAGLAALALLFALSSASPIWGERPLRELVTGWPIFNDLVLAYLLSALLMVLMGPWRWLRGMGWALGAVWVGHAIRHLWQGPDIGLARGIAQAELYAYTFALLLAGAITLAEALRRMRPDLRRIGLALVGLAAAKAFLIDAAALEGLLRAGAFLGLGLTLAGLAWLNSWVVARENRSA